MTSKTIALLSATLSLGALTGCDIKTDEEYVAEQNSFWQEVDDFAGSNAYYLDSTLWIDRSHGEYLDLQFQCFRAIDATVPTEVNLVVQSASQGEYSSPRYVNAVLHKRDNQSPQAFRDWQGQVISNFLRTSLDIRPILEVGEPIDLPQRLGFRFVYGAEIYEAEMGDVSKLSRSASVDFTLDRDQPSAAQFLEGCYPRLQNNASPSANDDAAPTAESAA